nr:putative tRNA pseudouridine synthase [Tanacetum cinerariifolium]
MNKFATRGGLEYLNLHNLPQCYVEDDAIIDILKGCPLSFCEKVGISGWESIELCCKNLKILHVNGCCNLGDWGLLSLGDGCKCLSVIYRTAGDEITTSGLRLFKKKQEDVNIKYFKKSYFYDGIISSWKKNGKSIRPEILTSVESEEILNDVDDFYASVMLPTFSEYLDPVKSPWKEWVELLDSKTKIPDSQLDEIRSAWATWEENFWIKT